jgi:serine/threonine-protein kinase RsbW
MVENKISIEFKNDLSELDGLCQKLKEFGLSLGLPKKTLFHINLVMEEVFTNIISYGFKDDAEHLVRITVSHENGDLELRTEDDGIPFNPTELEAPDLSCPIEDREIGGLGCYLTKRLMDNVEYQRLGDKNILILRKSIGDSH